MVNAISLINKHSYFMDNTGSDSDVANYVFSKGYLPNDGNLPKTSINFFDSDVTYLLSKLSDEELIKLLSDQPKKSLYDLNDIMKVSVDSKPFVDYNRLYNKDPKKLRDKYNNNDINVDNRFRTVSNDKDKGAEAYFRLDYKPVESYKFKSGVDPTYAATQKIINLMYSRPIPEDVEGKSDEDDLKKELLFDALVGQLKTLCCKKIKTPKHPSQNSIYTKANNEKKPTEYMFLIINDEIKSANSSQEIISVDPDSLERNSSVLLLGPITNPLTDGQLKIVMTRISNELSKPDYLPLLQQLSEGTLSGNKVSLMKSLVTGPETRRYIKPHRCNHQSRLAKVYYGPKWLICTGYLNLNTPSLYD